MEFPPQQPKKGNSSKVISILLVILVVAAGVIGYFFGYWGVSNSLQDLQGQLSSLSEQLAELQQSQLNWQALVNQTAGRNETVLFFNNTIYENKTVYVPYILGENVSLADLYKQVRDSVVIIRGVAMYYDVFGRRYYASVEGSGFVYSFNGRMVIITNHHVVADAVNVTVTFLSGNSYPATVLGWDKYVDLAVLSADAPSSEFKPLEVVNSSTLSVGDIVVAVGNPYGLAGSMSLGIVSALGRTLTTQYGYAIANVIQTTAPLNPGNSGGPLLNLKGQVIGITTAIVADSQGLGFAVPSNTLLREINDLVTFGSYNKHPWLGASGVDMNYEIAKIMGVNVTYGWLIVQVVKDGPADVAGLRGGSRQVVIAGTSVMIGGDIIIAINEMKITGYDALIAYLEEYTSPGQTINLTIIRGNQKLTVPMVLGVRP
ncbi:MAG: trypsin-like peptidase domain-containing protein [Candidatus Bathyarchaeia archaeon]